MSFRLIAASPFVFAALSLALLMVTPAALAPELIHALVELGKAAALVGLSAAAMMFDRGDYLRRGWGLLAWHYAFLLLRDAWLVASPEPSGAVVDALRAGLIVLANASVVAGTWHLARAWSVAGLDEPAARSARRIAVAVAVTASVVFAGPSLVADIHDAVTDGVRYWTIASDLGDLLALPLLAPVAMTAFAARDGALKWPWGLLSASLAGWLLYDAIDTIPQVFHLDRTPFIPVAETFRILATTCACAAGFAQRRVIQEFDAALGDAPDAEPTDRWAV